MKKIILSMFAMVLLAGAAQSQDPKAGKTKGHSKMAMQHLNLSDAQKTQLKSIREKQKSEMQALKKNDLMTVRDWKAKRKELQESHKSQVQSVLTQEQKDKLAKHKNFTAGKGAKKNHAMRQGKMHKKMAAKHRAKKIGQELNLTSTQKEKMKSINDEFKTKAQGIRNDSKLTKEQKKARFQELVKEQREERKTVLTKEQLQKIETLKKDRGNKTTK